MSNSYRRYEIVPPQRFKDGQPIPEGVIAEALLEAKREFVVGGKVYDDARGHVFVDVPDTPECRQFFAEFKERMKARFQQLDIWMTSYPIDVI